MIPRPGQYVRCIDDTNIAGHLTVGKIYLVQASTLSYSWVYIMREDTDCLGGYEPYRFEICYPVPTYNSSEKSTCPQEI